MKTIRIFLLGFSIIVFVACGNNRSYKPLDADITDISDMEIAYVQSAAPPNLNAYETYLFPIAVPTVNPLTIADFVQDLD